MIDELLRWAPDLPEKDDTEYRVVIPCALYVTVSGNAGLKQALIEFFGDQEAYDVDQQGEYIGVFYPGWESDGHTCEPYLDGAWVAGSSRDRVFDGQL